MKNRILLILGIIIFSKSITLATLINNPSIEGNEKVKVLVLEKNKNYKPINTGGQEKVGEPKIIKIGDRFSIKTEDGEKLNGYLGKIEDEGNIIIINKKGLIVGEIQLDKIIQVRYKNLYYSIGSKRYDLKIKTRIVTAKAKRKKEIGRSILGKTIWTVLGIAGTTWTFRRFL